MADPITLFVLGRFGVRLYNNHRRQEARRSVLPLIMALAEGGADLAALQEITVQARTEGWDEEQIGRAIRVIHSPNDARNNLARRLVTAGVRNTYAAEIIGDAANAILEGAIETGEFVGEGLALFFGL